MRDSELSVFSRFGLNCSSEKSLGQNQSNNEFIQKIKILNEIIDFYETKLEQKNVALDHFKSRAKKLEYNL